MNDSLHKRFTKCVKAKYTLDQKEDITLVHIFVKYSQIIKILSVWHTF